MTAAVASEPEPGAGSDVRSGPAVVPVAPSLGSRPRGTRVLEQPSDRAAGARLPFSGMGIARFAIGAQKPRPSAGIHSRLHFSFELQASA
jgi:hypothetical protein